MTDPEMDRVGLNIELTRDLSMEVHNLRIQVARLRRSLFWAVITLAWVGVFVFLNLMYVLIT